MKKKIVFMGFLLILTIVALIDRYTSSVYHMNVFQFYFVDHQLTQEDRDFLREHGPIIYGSDNNSPPLRFYDSDTDQYKGIVIDYLTALAIELETEIVFEPMVWGEALEALKRGDTDICDMYPSKKRSEVYLFSDPVYYQRGIILVSKEEENIKDYTDLKSRKVAIQNGDYANEFLRTNVSGVVYVFGNDYEENIKRLINGEVDAVVGDEPVISYFMGLYDMADSYKIVETPLYELPSVFSLPLNEKRMQGIINKGIYALNKKNIMNKIQQKWFGISTPIDYDNSVKKFTYFIIGVGLISSMLIMFVIIWNLELQKAVDIQTKALQISHNNLQTILDGVNQLIVVVGSDLSVLSGNVHFYRFFGISDPLSNYSLYNLLPGLNLKTREMWFENHESSEQIIKGRNFMVRPYSVQYENADQETILLMLEDITDKKINEAKMLQENKMAAVGQLATGVAHEIRNPLGLIRNYGYVLKRNLQDEKIVAQAINVIEESVDKASSIIDNLLNFSRLSDDTKKHVNLKNMLENIVSLNQKMMNRHNLRCKLILENLEIFIQEEALKHVLVNLINNAIDAMPHDGQLTICMRENKQGPCIYVIDTGIGMTKEVMSKLYNPFFTTKNIGEGTGLGLYIAYNEMEKLGGSLNVVSKLGKGTTFKLQLIRE